MPLTFATLRTSLKRSDAGYATNFYQDPTVSEAMEVSRMREVFHFGVRLCEAELGTPEEIKNLVDMRIREIESEEKLFVPNALEGDEEAKRPDLRWLEDGKLRRMVDAGEGGGEEEEDMVSETMSVSGEEEAVDIHDEEYRDTMPYLPSSPPILPITTHNNDAWETDTSSRSPSPTPFEAARLTHIVAQIGPTNTSKQLTFREVHTELAHALKGFKKEYKDEITTSPDFYEIQETFKDGIKEAINPRKDLTPEKLWSDVEESVLMSVRMDTRRQYEEDAVDGPSRLVRGTRVRVSRSKPLPPRLRFEGLEIEDKVGDDGDEEEDDHVRRMMAEVAEKDGDDESYVAGHGTPTHSPAWAELNSEEKRSRSNSSKARISEVDAALPITPELGVIAKLPSKASSQLPSATSSLGTLPASPQKDTAVTHHLPEPPAYTFSPVEHVGTSLTATPPIMQSYYRSTVQHTLEELLNSTSSNEVKDLLNAYWQHIEKEVPAPRGGET